MALRSNAAARELFLFKHSLNANTNTVRQQERERRKGSILSFTLSTYNFGIAIWQYGLEQVHRKSHFGDLVKISGNGISPKTNTVLLQTRISHQNGTQTVCPCRPPYGTKASTEITHRTTVLLNSTSTTWVNLRAAEEVYGRETHNPHPHYTEDKECSTQKPPGWSWKASSFCLNKRAHRFKSVPFQFTSASGE